MSDLQAAERSIREKIKDSALSEDKRMETERNFVDI